MPAGATTLQSVVIGTLGVGFLVIPLIALYVGLTARHGRLMKKYGHDKDLVDRLIRKTIWMGETAEQLRDSLGSPAAIDHKQLKTKRVEVWKYGRISKTRFKLRVTLENGSVTAWEHKDGKASLVPDP